jgi:hypothetical protein
VYPTHFEFLLVGECSTYHFAFTGHGTRSPTEMRFAVSGFFVCQFEIFVVSDSAEWQNKHPSISEQGWFWYWHPDLGEATPILVAWSADPEDYGWKYNPQKYPADSEDEWWKPMGYGPEGPDIPE